MIYDKEIVALIINDCDSSVFTDDKKPIQDPMQTFNGRADDSLLGIPCAQFLSSPLLTEGQVPHITVLFGWLCYIIRLLDTPFKIR